MWMSKPDYHVYVHYGLSHSGDEIEMKLDFKPIGGWLGPLFFPFKNTHRPYSFISNSTNSNPLRFLSLLLFLLAPD